jgi:putative addiction module killer protein
MEAGNPGHWRQVGGPIIELKENFGPGYRVYLAEDGDDWIVLLAGGDKSSQSKDIEIAKTYWAIFIERHRGGRNA